MTEFTKHNTLGTKDMVRDQFTTVEHWDGKEKADCYRNFSYKFDLDNNEYVVLGCDGDTIYTEKTINIKDNPSQTYQWEIMFDSVIYIYRNSTFPEYSPAAGVYIYSDYWKVDYLSSKKFQVSKTYYSIIEPTDFLKFTRVYEIIK